MEIGMCARDRLARLGMIAGVVALCGAGTAPVASAQGAPQPPPGGQAPTGAPPTAGQTPPAPPKSGATPPTGLSFVADAGLVLFTVKADGAGDFETFFAKVKEALEKSTKPEYKQIGAGWKVYKVTDTLQAGQLLYASVMDPATKGVDYDPVKILSELSSPEVTALYPKFKDALISVNRLNLQPVMKMGGT
jgi:hypothetical protein